MGCFPLARDYYCPAGKQQGHYPADAAWGGAVGCPPALARILCLEGADEARYQPAEWPLAETGGLAVSARQMQRVVQRVGQAAQAWQEREIQPEPGARSDASGFDVRADGTGIPIRPEGTGRTPGPAGRGQSQAPAGVSGMRVHATPAR